MNFTRTGNSKTSLRVGGYDFHSLRGGTILITKRMVKILDGKIHMDFKCSDKILLRGQCFTLSSVKTNECPDERHLIGLITLSKTQAEYFQEIYREEGKIPFIEKHIEVIKEITEEQFNRHFKIYKVLNG